MHSADGLVPAVIVHIVIHIKSLPLNKGSNLKKREKKVLYTFFLNHLIFKINFLKLTAINFGKSRNAYRLISFTIFSLDCWLGQDHYWLYLRYFGCI